MPDFGWNSLELLKNQASGRLGAISRAGSKQPATLSSPVVAKSDIEVTFSGAEEVPMVSKFIVSLSQTLFSWLAARADRYWAR